MKYFIIIIKYFTIITNRLTIYLEFRTNVKITLAYFKSLPLDMITVILKEF